MKPSMLLAALSLIAAEPTENYVARANALEDNVTVYYTVNGRRT